MTALRRVPAGLLPVLLAVGVLVATLAAVLWAHNAALTAETSRLKLVRLEAGVERSAAIGQLSGPVAAAGVRRSVLTDVPTVLAELQRRGVPPRTLAPARAALSTYAGTSAARTSVHAFAQLQQELLILDQRLGQLAERRSRQVAGGITGLLLAAGLCVGLLGRRWTRARQRAARLAAEQAERSHAESRFRALVQNASDIVLVVGADTNVRYATPSFTRVLGWTTEYDEPLADLVHPEERAALLAFLDDTMSRASVPDQVDLRIRHRDGHWVPTEALAANLLDEETIGGLALTIRDVTERRAFEDQLTHQAFHDGLTGLANRALFTDRLAHSLARRPHDPTTVAVLLLDLDDFKTINDSLGHDAGDELLCSVALRLAGCLRVADTPARLGGDEFAVLLEDVTGPAEAEEVAQRVLEALREPLVVADREHLPQASIGLAVADRAGTGAHELLRDADAAMYVAKRRGKDTLAVYRPEMAVELQARLELKSDLQRALPLDQLVLHYQPTVLLADGQIAGIEALLRWQHPTRGLVAPGEFIPVAEETGLIVPIGRWVLQEACRQAADWARRFPANQSRAIGVNLSARQLERDALVDEVAAALRESGLDPGLLVLEITESTLLTEAAQVIARLDALKALGVRLAIDDFGTGYSSLSYLRRLPVDILKVDKSFVDRVAGGSKDRALTSAIVSMARALGLQTVAEGVEHAEQAGALRSLDCDQAQGFLYHRPLPGPELTALLAQTTDGRRPGAGRTSSPTSR